MFAAPWLGVSEPRGTRSTRLTISAALTALPLISRGRGLIIAAELTTVPVRLAAPLVLTGRVRPATAMSNRKGAFFGGKVKDGAGDSPGSSKCPSRP